MTKFHFNIWKNKALPLHFAVLGCHSYICIFNICVHIKYMCSICILNTYIWMTIYMAIFSLPLFILRITPRASHTLRKCSASENYIPNPKKILKFPYIKVSQNNINITFFLCFSRQVFSVLPWLSWNSQCRPGWPGPQRSTSASEMLGLKVCASTNQFIAIISNDSYPCYQCRVLSWHTL